MFLFCLLCSGYVSINPRDARSCEIGDKDYCTVYSGFIFWKIVVVRQLDSERFQCNIVFIVLNYPRQNTQ